MCDKIITLSTWQNLFENPEWSGGGGGGVGNELKKVAVRMEEQQVYNNNFRKIYIPPSFFFRDIDIADLNCK